ncbi:MAG: thiamine-phosphate kinase [Verrucomicrobiae bacterium]|nr:thiamine-phosphate kinase [Verrucomicrobiae bacterium]
MNELELIESIKPLLPTNESIIVGAGDDCAVLNSGLTDKWLLFKTDAVVEGVHFTGDAAPQKVGHKALGRCLSDIAAMGGKPTAALVTLGLPKTFSTAYIQSIYSGMALLAGKYNVAIAGGETTTSPERIIISVSLLGMVEKKHCVLRKGAKPGDAIFVTGELGGSIEGKHLEFEPRINEASWLVQNFKPNAMIDISDGLATDLRHITVEHGLGAELLASAIPISRVAKKRSLQRSAEKPALTAALTDGEDFELLFTISSTLAVSLVDAWKKQFPDLQLSCIGKVLPEMGFKIRTKNGIFDITEHGYIHFQ